MAEFELTYKWAQAGASTDLLQNSTMAEFKIIARLFLGAER